MRTVVACGGGTRDRSSAGSTTPGALMQAAGENENAEPAVRASSLETTALDTTALDTTALDTTALDTTAPADAEACVGSGAVHRRAELATALGSMATPAANRPQTIRKKASRPSPRRLSELSTVALCSPRQFFVSEESTELGPTSTKSRIPSS